MKKRFILVLTILVLALEMIGCKKTNIENPDTQSYNDNSQLQNNVNETSSESPSVSEASATTSEIITENLFIKKLNIEIDSTDRLNTVGIIENLFIYGIDISNDDETGNSTFYSYNMDTDNITEIGTIKNVRYSSGVNAVFQSGFIYCTIDDNHYEIDINNRIIKVLSTGMGNSSLANAYAVNDQYYIEYQWDFLENDQKSGYISLCSTDGEVKKIIVKETKEAPELGELICAVSVYGQKIYTYEQRGENGAYVNYICTYDLEGNELNSEKISQVDSFLSNLTDNDFIVNFNVINDLYFFQSSNNLTLVLKKSGDKYEKVNIISENMVYVDQSTYIKEDQTKYLFKNLENDFYYIFNSETEQFTVLDFPYENIKNITYYENKFVVYCNDGLYYHLID